MSQKISELNKGTRFNVVSIRERAGKTIWVKAGTAFVNADGSINVLLDVLPLDGKLQIRPMEAKDAKDTQGDSSAPAAS